MQREIIWNVSFAVAIGAATLASSAFAQSAADLPPNAKPGECYARTFVPAEYTSETEQVLRSAADERIEIVPAKYEMVQERVVVKEAASKLVPVPATYETIRETVEVEPARSEWRLGSGAKSKAADRSFVNAAAALGVPVAEAQPGQCFVERVIEAQYATRSEQVVKSGASSRVEIVPARYEWVEERVLVKEAGERIVEMPAEYETQSEQMLVKAAHQVWKKGRGLKEKVDHATGEVMCLVEVPAEYRTVNKRVQVRPATIQRVVIPAEYKTVKVQKLVAPASEKRIEVPAQYASVNKREKVSDASRFWVPVGASAEGSATGQKLCLAEISARTESVTRRVEKTPATSKRVEIPAEYQTVEVRKLVTPAQERRIEIPAEYQTVTKRKLERDGALAWQAVLCETNATPELVTRIQRGLKQAGHDPGEIDGIAGQATLAAMRDFQSAKGISTGGFTMATLEALGVR